MSALVIAWLIAAVCFVGALVEQPILRWWQRRQAREAARHLQARIVPPDLEPFRAAMKGLADSVARFNEAIRHDDDGCIARAVLFGLAAEGLVAAVVWAVLR